MKTYNYIKFLTLYSILILLSLSSYSQGEEKNEESDKEKKKKKVSKKYSDKVSKSHFNYCVAMIDDALKSS